MSSKRNFSTLIIIIPVFLIVIIKTMTIGHHHHHHHHRQRGRELWGDAGNEGNIVQRGTSRVEATSNLSFVLWGDRDHDHDHDNDDDDDVDDWQDEKILEFTFIEYDCNFYAISHFCLKMDVEYFPFDEQTCVMKFGSWTYDGFQVFTVML